jgi:hypothetical protein
MTTDTLFVSGYPHTPTNPSEITSFIAPFAAAAAVLAPALEVSADGAVNSDFTAKFSSNRRQIPSPATGMVHVSTIHVFSESVACISDPERFDFDADFILSAPLLLLLLLLLLRALTIDTEEPLEQADKSTAAAWEVDLAFLLTKKNQE